MIRRSFHRIAFLEAGDGATETHAPRAKGSSDRRRELPRGRESRQRKRTLLVLQRDCYEFTAATIPGVSRRTAVSAIRELAQQDFPAQPADSTHYTERHGRRCYTLSARAAAALAAGGVARFTTVEEIASCSALSPHDGVLYAAAPRWIAAMRFRDGALRASDIALTPDGKALDQDPALLAAGTEAGGSRGTKEPCICVLLAAVEELSQPVATAVKQLSSMDRTNGHLHSATAFLSVKAPVQRFRVAAAPQSPHRLRRPASALLRFIFFAAGAALCAVAAALSFTVAHETAQLNELIARAGATAERLTEADGRDYGVRPSARERSVPAASAPISLDTSSRYMLFAALARTQRLRLQSLSLQPERIRLSGTSGTAPRRLFRGAVGKSQAVTVRSERRTDGRWSFSATVERAHPQGGNRAVD